MNTATLLALKARKFLKNKKDRTKKIEEEIEKIVDFANRINIDNVYIKKSKFLENCFIAEIIYEGRFYNTAGNNKKDIMRRLKRMIALDVIKGEWVSEPLLESLNKLVDSQIL